MKRKIYVLGVIMLCFVFLGGCIKKKEETVGTSETTSETTDSKFEGTLKDLMKRGKDSRCTYSVDIEGVQQSGVIYMADKKVRGDFIVRITDEKETKTHFINDGEYQWVWSDGNSEGMKMSMEKLEAMQEEMQYEGQAETNASVRAMNERIDYDCSAWRVDKSKFVLPKNVNFRDFGVEMEKMQDQMKGMCSSCDQIPDAEARAECRKNLGCE